MSLSSIAAEQREREEDALRSFLAFSLIGSLALHAVVLTFGNFWSRTPELAEEPIEVLVLDPPSLQVPQPTEEAESKGESGSDGSSRSEGGAVAAGGGGGSSGGGRTPITASAPSSKPPAEARSLPKPAPSIAPSAPPVIAEKQPTPVETAPTQKLVENLNRSPAQRQKPAQTPPPEIAAEPKPVITPSPSPSASPKPASTPPPAPVAVNQSPQTAKPAAPNSPPPQTREQDTEKLRELLAGVRNSRESQGIATNNTGSSDKPSRVSDAGRGLRQRSSVAAGTGNRTESGSGTGTGNGSGQGTGTSTGNKPGNGSTVATGSRTSRREGSGSGRLACRKCSKPNYPQSARRQGHEGTATISVDVDDKGNVTNVRLVRSSGHSALDEAAIRGARRWKFDAPNGARQGIIAKVDFAIEGSE